MSHLSTSESERYSRQIILPELSSSGQAKLLGSRVLVVGAGGLGCPVALYLAAAGVGCIGVVDYDAVEVSNLQRQVLHCEAEVGKWKADSVCQAIERLNSGVLAVPHRLLLSVDNVLSVLRQYDLVADCSDNVPTRYLVSDACVTLAKPLVSGSALRWEGQLSTYNVADAGCYRCLFPQPPPAEAVSNCAEVGVLGAITGVVGCLQALEIIKLCAGLTPSFAGKLLVFDGFSAQQRVVTLGPRRNSCRACVDRGVGHLAEVNYVQFCGVSGIGDQPQALRLLQSDDRIGADELPAAASCCASVVVDIRPSAEFEICSLPNSVNIPVDLGIDSTAFCDRFKQLADDQQGCLRNLIVVCHHGNDSQLAVQTLKRHLCAELAIRDVIGGLDAYAKQVDPTFLKY